MGIIYVKMDGRLGNQMFQYAFARNLQKITGGELILDFSSLKLNKAQGIMGKDGLENSLEHFNVTPYKYVDMGNFDASIIPHFQWRIFKFWRKIKPMTKRQWYIEIVEFFDHKILQHFGIIFLESANSYRYFKYPALGKNKNYFLRGWFESEKYFKTIKNELKIEFTPKYPLPNKFLNLYDRLKNEESICVTIRRGDFTHSAYSSRYLVCSKNYYYKGIEFIRSRYNNALCFICSDDLEWCRNNIRVEGNVLFEPDGLTIWDKLRIMSACHHFVISNSTFSWWCQYLSDNPNKIVVAPKTWRNVFPKPHDIYQKEWIILE